MDFFYESSNWPNHHHLRRVCGLKKGPNVRPMVLESY